MVLDPRAARNTLSFSTASLALKGRLLCEYSSFYSWVYLSSFRWTVTYIHPYVAAQSTSARKIVLSTDTCIPKFTTPKSTSLRVATPDTTRRTANIANPAPMSAWMTLPINALVLAS